MTDVDGVRGADRQRLATIGSAEAEELIAAGVITGGMIPKVRAAIAAAVGTGSESAIVDGSAPDALVRAIEDPTFGTRIVGRSAGASAGA